MRKGFIEAAVHDLRYALRSLRKSRGFSAAAIITLALGIGSTTTIFSAFNGIVLRPLPFHEPHALVFAEEKQLPRFNEFEATPAHFIAWQQETRTLSGIAAFVAVTYTFTGSDEAERVSGTRVSANLTSVLGVQPIVGRGFAPEEDKPGNNAVVLIGEGLWRRRFGSDPNIVGRSLMLNGVRCAIIGVMPQSFRFPRVAEIWRPMAFTDAELGNGGHFVWAVGRMKPGVTAIQVENDLEAILRGMPQHPWGAKAFPLLEYYVGTVQSSLYVLLSAVACLLLIACANVAGLVLARGSARRQEIAVRLSIGATRSRIVRQLMTESIVLSLIGGIAGVMLSAAGIGILRRLTSAGIPRMDQVSLDIPILQFALAISIVTGLLIGVSTALRLSKVNLHDGLAGGVRTTEGRIHHRYRGTLVAAELALALVLLVGAGLLGKSFVRLMNVDPGFRPEHLVATSILLPAARYPQASNREQFAERLLELIKTTPGVQDAAVATNVPVFGGKRDVGIRIDTLPPGAPAGGTAQYFGVTPGYLHTMGVKLTRGRFIEDEDRISGRKVVLLNETMAKQFFANTNPIGHRLDIAGPTFLREIVGVVSDVKRDGLELQSTAQVYEPFWQNPSNVFTLLLRTSDDQLPSASELKQHVYTIDKDIPIATVRSMDDVVNESLGPRRFAVQLLVVFTGFAVVMAFVGTYGLMAYIVAQRTKEFGIRIAFGARGSEILRLVMHQGIRIVAPGVLGGLLASIALNRFLRSLLFEIKASDPLVYGLLSIGLIIVALGAALIPAIRASRHNPVSLLR
jgi:putative ABC transport system permease protein